MGEFFPFFFKGRRDEIELSKPGYEKISFLMKIPNTRKIDRTGTKEVTAKTRGK